METRKRLYGVLFTKVNMLIFIVLLISSACNTMDEEASILSVEDEVKMVQNNDLLETYADEDLDLVSKMAISFAEGKYLVSRVDSCADVSWNETSKVLRIDFGEGCVGPYGRTRSGVIYVAHTAGIGEVGGSKVITYENYFVNNRQVLGTIEIDKLIMNDGGYYENTFSLINYTVLFPNEESFILNGMRKREFIQGLDDDLPLITRISGNMQGVDSRGRSFESAIITPIIADASCAESGGFMRVSGEKEVLFSGIRGNKTRRVLFGDGNCDNTIEVIINGSSHIITKS